MEPADAVEYHLLMSTGRLSADVVMLGTFSTWNLGTIQARGLPLAQSLTERGIRIAIVTTPWDRPEEAGVIDMISDVLVINTSAASTRNPVPAVKQQLQWVRALNPSLSHVLKPRGFGGLAGRALLNHVPVVVDSDDWEGDGGWNDSGQYGWLQQRVFQAQEVDLLRNAHRITSASTLLAERAKQLRGDSTTTSLIPNGLSNARIEHLGAARMHPPSVMNPPVVTIYSRFAEFETDWLPRYIDALSNAYSGEITVRIIGDSRVNPSPWLRPARVLIEQMGYVPYEDIPLLLGTSTLAVYPYRDSLITRSKQSVKLLELMAAGCPVIASDVGDVPLTLAEAGTVLDGASPFAFARATVDTLSNPAQLDAMSRQGIKLVGSRFRFDVLAASLLDTYRAAGLQCDAS